MYIGISVSVQYCVGATGGHCIGIHFFWYASDSELNLKL